MLPLLAAGSGGLPSQLICFSCRDFSKQDWFYNHVQGQIVLEHLPALGQAASRLLALQKSPEDWQV